MTFAKEEISEDEGYGTGVSSKTGSLVAVYTELCSLEHTMKKRRKAAATTPAPPVIQVLHAFCRN